MATVFVICILLLATLSSAISREWMLPWIDPRFGHVAQSMPHANAPAQTSKSAGAAASANLASRPSLRAKVVAADAVNTSAAGWLHKEGAIKKTTSENQPIVFDKFNMFFVTDCTAHQRWMAFNIFNSAQHVGQKCPVVWVRAGCRKGDPRHARDVEHATGLYSQAYVFDVHGVDWANDFNLAGGVPKAVNSFLSAHPHLENDTMLTLIEADMIFLQPLSLDYLSSRGIPSQDRGLVWEGSTIYGDMLAVAAHYLCCDGLGPPYIVSTKGWREVAPHWSSSKLSGGWGGDQEAFAASAKAVGLTFNVFDDLMLSSPDTMPSGWSLVNAALRSNAGDVCLTQHVGMQLGVSNLPVMLHVVQPWSTQANRAATAWGFSKYQVPPGWHHPESSDGILECGMPMFAVPPRDFLATLGLEKNNGWVLCTILLSLNDMLYKYKTMTCPGGFNKAKALKMKVPLEWTNFLLAGAEDGAPPGTDLAWMRRCSTEPNC